MQDDVLKGVLPLFYVTFTRIRCFPPVLRQIYANLRKFGVGYFCMESHFKTSTELDDDVLYIYIYNRMHPVYSTHPINGTRILYFVCIRHLVRILYSPDLHDFHQ